MTPQSTRYRTFRGTIAAIVLILMLGSTGWAASEEVLYRFHGKDGDGPVNVIVGAGGALYGTTVAGGRATKSCLYKGCGVVFWVALGTDGKWHETVLHRFAGTDGWFPEGPLVADKAGNLYGTTVNGGTTCSQLGCGVVFELARGKGDKWTFTVLHEFAVTDGANPYAGLIFGSGVDLYGTASSGGNVSACPNEGGCGVVFKLAPDGKGNWSETVIYAFNGGDGEVPYAPLVLDGAGRLYGTTQAGGAYGSGTVFRLTLGSGGQWRHEILHSFDETDGQQPYYGVTLDGNGNIYGTTPSGGTYHWGTAFELTPTGSGMWKQSTLHSFDRDKGVGGGFVSSGLILDAEGNLYGSTGAGGKYNNGGVVFKLTPRAKGRWGETVLHSFGRKNDGSGPIGGLVFDSSNHLLGAASIGGRTGGLCGQGGCGMIFEVTP